MPNLAPSGTDKTITIQEDGRHVLTLADFGFSDPDGNSLLQIVFDLTTWQGRDNRSVALHHVSPPGGGSSSTFWDGVTTIAASEIAAGKVSITTYPEYSGNAGALKFQVRDNGGTVGGGRDLDPTANSLFVNVAYTNDTPILDITNGFAHLAATAYAGLTLNGAAATGAFTIELAFRTDQQGAQTLLNANSMFGSNSNILIQADGKLAYSVGGVTHISSSSSVVDGQWHKFSLTYDGSGAHQLYIDGALIGGKTGLALNSGWGAKGITLGSATSGASGFVGDVDDLTIWTVARTGASISSNAPLSGAETGLAGLYKFHAAAALINSATSAAAPTGYISGPVSFISQPFAIGELADTSESSFAHQLSGKLSFKELETAQTHTLVAAAPTVSIAGGGSAPAATLTALASALSTTLTDGAGSGSVSYSLSLADKFLDFLTAGQVMTVTYGITLQDSGGASTTQPLTVQFTGSADGPAGPTAGADSLLGTTAADLLSGLGGADSLSGGDGADTLVGGSGADTLNGGGDGDTASYDASTAGVTVDLRLTGAQVSAGDAADDVLVGIEHVTGSALADALTGGDGDNRLEGGDGADTLVGGLGADTLVGGAGVDVVSFATAASRVDASLAEGTALRLVSAGVYDYDLLSEIENLTGSGHSDRLAGNSADNVLRGLTGLDLLVGSGGSDTLDGGAEVDRADYTAFTSAVSVTLNGAGTATVTKVGGVDTLVSIENVLGGSGDDLLDGLADAGGNTLSGGGGADTLRGGAGDNLAGGTGDDLFEVAAGAVIDERAGGGTDTVSTGASSWTLLGNLEDLVFTGSGANTGYGNASANRMDGGDGNDTLVGAGGADTLVGGLGLDTASYVQATSGVVASLAVPEDGAGDAAGDVFDGIEHLTGSNLGDRLVGDGGANRLDGGGGNDTLVGGAGADTLVGGAGVDVADYSAETSALTADLSNAVTAFGAAAGDVFQLVERLIGGSGEDALYGDGAGNLLVGGDGIDTLMGRGGADTLTGGENSDLFLFTARTDLNANASASDRITDFVSGTDLIDLRDIDANLFAPGDQEFAVVTAFTGVAGQLRLSTSGPDTLISGDLNGDRAADFVITLTGSTAVAGDFLL